MVATDLPTLGIIAGAGSLPRRIADRCAAQGRHFHLLLLDGHADPALHAGLTFQTVRLGAAGEMFERMREAGCREVVFAGKVERPSWRALRPDWRATKFIAEFAFRADKGDNALMAAIVATCEAEGFKVRAPAELLGESQMPPGPLGRLSPDGPQRDDIRLGITVARAIGRLDVGHAVVVQAGLVLGVEAAEGTDRLIERCGALRRDGVGPILIKLRKPQQEIRADPPTIGPATVACAAAAGFSGIAIEAGGTLVIDPEATVADADRAGLFLLAVEAPE
ncbi:UDP-2,3-diacylglucosamine pyrophosphatase [Hypericibacter terrae]|uniref:UDP-2,3-diacylglucosamine pyrophosphatase n=1 Tax=Hypericibacter terrae TaxID=2602015 RepID=A0A5J6MI79_9PROT|nr:UDP-2,3-diacylglucosamine diphosphatase LpxI [Hypericibacter terrae]QEX17164.1 UDP-2,3-diacylglucosamine pyrophosphatase [Hypericibacter terrae]